jgi:hypothetical protein
VISLGEFASARDGRLPEREARCARRSTAMSASGTSAAGTRAFGPTVS